MRDFEIAVFRLVYVNLLVVRCHLVRYHISLK